MSSFDLNSANVEYIEGLYEQHLREPGSLDPEWAIFFKGFELGYQRAEEEEEAVDGRAATPAPKASPAVLPKAPAVTSSAPPVPQVEPAVPQRAPKPPVGDEVAEQAAPNYADRRKRERSDKGVYGLVQAYRQFGHYIAKVDPLGHNRQSHPLLELSEFGLGEADLEKGVGFGGFRGKADGSLRDLIAKLQATYCASLGVDFMAISDKNQLTWLEDKIEPTGIPPIRQKIMYSIC